MPLVSAVALLGLAASAGYGYLQGRRDLVPGCAIPEGCPAIHALWLDAALVFGAAAAAVGLLFAMDTNRARRGAAVRASPRTVLVAGLALLAFGLGGFLVVQQEPYGTVPPGSGAAMWVAYVTGALLLLAVAFLGHRYSPRVLDRWAAILSVAHGLVGMGLGFALAYLAVVPPDWVT